METFLNLTKSERAQSFQEAITRYSGIEDPVTCRASRSTEKHLPRRLFRHYYNLLMLDQYGITQEALKNTELFDMVVQNNKTFFYSSRANYETANIGKLRLSPNKYFLPALKKDYVDMEGMFFGKGFCLRR